MASAAGPPPLLARLLMRVAQVISVLLASIVMMAVITSIWWRLTPSRDLDVFVYDQTVANDTYPDHAVLEQLLQYHRVAYDVEDYVGAAPGGGPYGVWPQDRPDVIFLADLYGLYINEDGQLDENGSIRITDRLTAPQADDVARWIAAGTPAYAEFGLVSEPTAEAAGALLEDVFGFRATGWAIKPFEDLQNVSPQIQSLQPSPWTYEGPGWIAVHIAAAGRASIRDLVVLPEAVLTEPLPIVSGGPPGSDGGQAPFKGWLGVIEAKETSKVDAWVQLGVTDEGLDLLDAAGIPNRFPALVRTERTLYFAGDGLDDETPFRLRRLKGGALFTRLVTGEEFRFLYQVLEPSVGWMLQQLDEQLDEP